MTAAERPLVSVVVPVHNREASVRRSIASILGQSYANVEVIAVDDGSRDGTWAELERIAAEDDRVRLVRHEQARGAQAARNSGIAASRGEWIAFLDSDDEWFPDSLEIRMSAAAEKNAEAVYSDCIIQKPDGVEEPWGVPGYEGEAYADLLRHPGPMFNSLMATRTALERITPLDETLASYQEWDTSIRLSRESRFAFVPAPTCVYDCRHPGTISKDAMKGARGYERVLEKHRDEIVRVLGRRALATHYRSLAELFAQAGLDDVAKRWVWKAFFTSPSKPSSLLRTLRRIDEMRGEACASE